MELQDWLDTVLEYLKVFAWPAVVLTLALIYRKPLIGVLQRLHKAAGFGASVELENALEQNARALNEASLPELASDESEAKDAEPKKSAMPEGGIETPADEDSEFKQLWSPSAIRRFWRTQPARAAELGIPYPDRDARSGLSDAENYGLMMLAWAHLEAKAVRLGALIGLSASSARNLGVLSGKLLDRDHISHEGAEIARGLQRLRNELAHEVENISISNRLTADFVGTAEKLNRLFDQVIEELELPKKD